LQESTRAFQQFIWTQIPLKQRFSFLGFAYSFCLEIGSQQLSHILIFALLKVFRVSLEELVQRDVARFGSELTGDVPVIISTLVAQFIASGAESIEGIFRIPGQTNEIHLDQEHMDAGADEVGSSTASLNRNAGKK
jgi:hypothetical protein